MNYIYDGYYYEEEDERTEINLDDLYINCLSVSKFTIDFRYNNECYTLMLERIDEIIYITLAGYPCSDALKHPIARLLSDIFVQPDHPEEIHHDISNNEIKIKLNGSELATQADLMLGEIFTDDFIKVLNTGDLYNVR